MIITDSNRDFVSSEIVTYTGRISFFFFFLLFIKFLHLDSCIFHILGLRLDNNRHWNLENRKLPVPATPSVTSYSHFIQSELAHTGMGTTMATGVCWEYMFIGTGTKTGTGTGTGTMNTFMFSSLSAAEIIMSKGRKRKVRVSCVYWYDLNLK